MLTSQWRIPKLFLKGKSPIIMTYAEMALGGGVVIITVSAQAIKID
jgi:hypothetical protein